MVRGDITVEEGDLPSLSNNLTVMRVLNAAKRSAEAGEAMAP